MSNQNIYKETIYKDSFYKQIKTILGDNKDFIKKNKLNKSKTYQKLKELTLFSEVSNTFTQKELNYNIFIEESNKFYNIYTKLLKQIVIRKDSGNFGNQLKLCVELSLNYCFNRGYIEEESSEQKIEEIINKLTPKLIFNILLTTCVSSIIRIPLVNDDNQEKIEVESTEINRLTYSRKLIKNMIIHIIMIILEDNQRASSILLSVNEDIPNIINDPTSNLSNCFIKSTYQLISIFCESFEIRERTITFVNKKRQNRSYTFLNLPLKIVELNISASHLPEIIEPSSKYDNIVEEINLSKKIKNGYSSVQMSNLTKSALRISEKKMFKINNNTLKLFKKLDEMSYEDVKHMDILPFTPINHLKYIENQIKLLESQVEIDKLNKIKGIYFRVRKEGKFVPEIEGIIKGELNINQQELDKLNLLYKLKKDFKKRINLRKLHNTTLLLAEIFEGFPLYYVNSFDYRLRMYTWNYMFSRTTGIYKYLLIEEPLNVNNEGIHCMIKAYYNEDIKKLDEYDNIKGNSIEFLINWFQEYNLNDISRKNSFIYKYLLGKEIKYLKKNKFKTGFMLEIDQKSSASVLFSIILGDEILAQKTNLLNDGTIQDPNNFIMNESKLWFKDKISDKSYEIITKERKIHKYLFMCYIYNQTFYGRISRIEEFLSNQQDIKEMATLYPSFIDNIFPRLTIKKKKFNDLIRFYLKSSEIPIEIETLDGSILSWTVFNKDRTKNRKLKIRDPITNKYRNYDYPFLSSQEANVNKMITGLLPSFIHSLDGAIMRLIILDVYKNSKYIINHLHDSIQFHPNNHKIVLESINNVYTSELMKDVLNKKFLVRLENNILEEKKQKFNEIKDEIYDKNFKEVNINKNNFKSENMFPFE